MVEAAIASSRTALLLAVGVDANGCRDSITLHLFFKTYVLLVL